MNGIVNSGKEEVTVVTEHLDCGFLGIEKDSNSLRCVLSFDAEIKYKNEYLTVPSIYKYAPVTLKRGEVAIVNYYRDYSTVLNAKGMGEKNLEADNIVITYNDKGLLTIIPQVLRRGPQRGVLVDLTPPAYHRPFIDNDMGPNPRACSNCNILSYDRVWSYLHAIGHIRRRVYHRCLVYHFAIISLSIMVAISSASTAT